MDLFVVFAHGQDMTFSRAAFIPQVACSIGQRRIVLVPLVRARLDVVEYQYDIGFIRYGIVYLILDVGCRSSVLDHQGAHLIVSISVFPDDLRILIIVVETGHIIILPCVVDDCLVKEPIRVGNYSGSSGEVIAQ